MPYLYAFSGVKISGPFPHCLSTLSPQVGSRAMYKPLTALTAEKIAAARTLHPDEDETKEGLPGVRGGKYEDIPIHSVRLPGYVAHQEVLFGGYGEILTVRHDSLDRKSFMPGVMLACHKVMKIPGLVYGLENYLK